MATLYEQLHGSSPYMGVGGDWGLAGRRRRGLMDEVFSPQQSPQPAAMVPDAPQAPSPPPQQVPQRRRGPSLLDYVWGAAAGVRPSEVRNVTEKQNMEMDAARRSTDERARILETITDPRERAAFIANPAKWGENVAQRYGVNNLARGAILSSGEGQILAANPYTHMTGDEIVGVGPQGANRIYTREAPSIEENIKREGQVIDRERLAADTALRREGFEVQREGHDVQRDVAGMARDDKLAEANEATQAELSGYRNIGTRISDMKRSAIGDSSTGAPPEFEIGPLAAARYESELAIGRPSRQAAAYGLFRTNVQQIVNDSLRLNTGVQTEGDAKREAESIMRNIHNPTYVAERLDELQKINDRAIKSREEAIARRESRMTRPQPQARRPQSPVQRAQSAISGPVRVTSIAQARALPSGTRFIDPNGVERIVP